jgi:hypothetical protein
MELRVVRVLADVLTATGGIDHNYCINQCSLGGLTFVARLGKELHSSDKIFEATERHHCMVCEHVMTLHTHLN